MILPFYQPEIAMLQCPAPAQLLAAFLKLPAAFSWPVPGAFVPGHPDKAAFVPQAWYGPASLEERG